MKELTFKEVIANIEEGEVWKNECRFIKCVNGNVSIHNKGKNKSDCFLFTDDYKFELQRKEVSFQEAFAAFKEGKEIESDISTIRYANWKGGNLFSSGEISGRWYINS